MKLLVLITFVLFTAASFGQNPTKAELFDEFTDRLCSDEIKARLDHFLAALSQERDSVGFLVANADSTIPGRSQKYLRFFQTYSRFRRFDPDRLKYFRGPDRDSLTVQLWVVPKGATPPEIDLYHQRKQISEPVVFDASEITSVKKGVVYFGGEWANEPCDFGLDLNMYAIYLGGNPDLEAYFVASAKSDRKHSTVRTALRLTASKLTREHGISRSRIKTLFVGNKKYSEMQLWLVPKGMKPTEFSSRLYW